MLENVLFKTALDHGYRPSAAELLHEVLRHADVHQVAGGEVLVLPLSAGLYDALACFDLDGDPDAEPDGDCEYSLASAAGDAALFAAARARRRRRQAKSTGSVPATPIIHRLGKAPSRVSCERAPIVSSIGGRS